LRRTLKMSRHKLHTAEEEEEGDFDDEVDDDTENY
jgi:hypothetical protein